MQAFASPSRRSGQNGSGVGLAAKAANAGVCALLAVSLAACSVQPTPLSEGEFALRASSSIKRMTAGQEPVTRTIGLGEAVARALKYNLALRVKQEETSLAFARLDLKHYSMLPEAVVNSGYSKRNKHQASTSLNLDTNQRDENHSTSQDRIQWNNDVSLSWDILDFGLSYVRAKQAADDVLISREIWRSTMQKLVEDVRTHYWRAATYQRLVGRLKDLDRRATAAIASSRKLSQSSEVDRLVALNAERELVKVRQAIKDLEQELIDAKSELARLMNLKPGTPYVLDSARREHKRLKIRTPLEDLFQIAVTRRPEMRQNFYEQRINTHEAQAAVLELLPSLRGYADVNSSTNSFLLNSNWLSAGAAVSWSLINVFQYPAKRRNVDAKQELLDKQALALSMTIVSQVYLGLLRYGYYGEKLDMAGSFLSVQKRLTRQMRLEKQAERVSEQELILEEMNELIAEARHDMANAELQKAYGGLVAALGIDHLPLLDTTAPVDALAAELERHWSEASELHGDLELALPAAPVAPGKEG